jgi:hypothetical protein
MKFLHVWRNFLIFLVFLYLVKFTFMQNFISFNLVKYYLLYIFEFYAKFHEIGR